MNRQIRIIGVAIMVLFVALFLNLNWLQVVHAPALNANPLNTRQVVKEFETKRGTIVSADGVTLAQSTPTSDGFKYLRQYPTGDLFQQITGFFSFTYGSDGLEKTYDRTLTGANAPFRLSRLFSNSDKTQSLNLTVLDSLQRVAQQQLRGRDGSVVALNPKTGAILAMYSNPAFDPNLLSGHNQQQVQANYKQITSTPGGLLTPAGYRQRFFPGSTFKIVTSAAVYDHDTALATKAYPFTSSLPLPNTTNVLHNFGGERCGGMLPELFIVSCNTGFGQIGLDLGANNLTGTANSFGFNQTPPIDLPYAVQSIFPPASSFAQDLPGLAYSAIGQQDVQATPLQMAMIAGAVADGGTMMTPHVLDHVTNAQAQIVSTYQAKPWLQATSPQTASQLTTLMESVVSSPNGTGVAARIPGVQVAAKTGTAQTGTGQIDAWFAAFAPANNPTIAIAVLVPNQPSADEYQGGTIAAPIAKAVVEAWLASPQGTAATGGSTATGASQSSTTTP